VVSGLTIGGFRFYGVYISTSEPGMLSSSASTTVA